MSHSQPNPIDMVVGPKGTDLTDCRPYILVPLLELATDQARANAQPNASGAGRVAVSGRMKLIVDALSAVQADPNHPGPITDLYVVSHGWHRNFTGALAAYDRLVSRFSVLKARGVLPSDEKYKSAFIALHWHSDPGQDQWMDSAGRRDKANFLENVKEIFDPVPDTSKRHTADFLTDFEKAFQTMATWVTPKGEQDKQVDSLGTTWLEDYKVLDVPIHKDLSVPEKVSLLWRCYFEAESKAFLVDQEEQSIPMGSPPEALATIVRFSVSLGALGLLASKIFGVKTFAYVEHIFKHTILSDGWDSLCNSLLPKLPSALDPNHPSTPLALQWFLALTLMGLGSTAILWGLGELKSRNLQKQFQLKGRSQANAPSSASGLPIGAGVAWIGAQLFCLVPVVIYIIQSWIFRSFVAYFSIPFFLLWGVKSPIPLQDQDNQMQYIGLGVLLFAFLFGTVRYYRGLSDRPLFDEKLKAEKDKSRDPANILAEFARWPAQTIKRIVGPDSILYKAATTLDNQLAFFVLQQKGVDAGNDAGDVLNQLLEIKPELKDARIHFIGHSFGGLVVLNAARRMFGDLDGQNPPKPKEEVSITLLEAAVASGWFNGEKVLLKNVSRIGCVYSKYDTANGFFYPAANGGRNAAGFLGVCKVDGYKSDPKPIGHDGSLAMVISPPSLPTPIDKEDGIADVWNLDASRIIFNGPASSGGGHDDLFKDDVVNIVWTVSMG
jgi:hypothetical protein